VLWIKLAWRNIWRNSRRTSLTVAAVVFAVTLSIVQRGIQLGTYEVNIRNAVRLSSGFLQIQKQGFQKNPILRKSFNITPQIEKALHEQSQITGYAPRIYADALISFRDKSFGSFLIGIDPRKEPLVSDYSQKVNAGRFLQVGDTSGIVVGYKLLKNLQASIGDSIVILSQGYDGFLNSMFGVIKGTVKIGSNVFDRMAIFMNLPTAQYFLGMENRVNIIAISLNRLKDIPRVKKSLRSELANTDLTVLSWDEILPELKQSIELDNIGGILFLGILIIVVAFGILNTVLMSVTERTREFGILLSIGLPNKRLAEIVIIETLFVVALGIIIGNLLGAGINYYIVNNPITIGGKYATVYEEYGFLPLLASTMDIRIFLNTTLSVVIISIISIIYPLWHVLKLEPLKGIRYT